MDKGKGGAPGPRTRGKRRDRSSARYRPTMWDQAYSIEMWIVEPAWDLALIMAALRSRCGHYIFTMWFLSIFFIPRLILGVAHRMSAILRHMMWP